MTKKQYQERYEDIERAMKTGEMTATHAMARVAILSIDYANSRKSSDKFLNEKRFGK